MPLVELVRRSMTRTCSPAATSWRVTWEPKKPLAPMTSFVALMMWKPSMSGPYLLAISVHGSA